MKECKGKGEYSVLFTHVYAQIDGVEKEKKETGSAQVVLSSCIECHLSIMATLHDH